MKAGFLPVANFRDLNFVTRKFLAEMNFAQPTFSSMKLVKHNGSTNLFKHLIFANVL